MKKFQAKFQTFAGAMMVPVILLVLTGFFVGIGAAFTNYILPEGTLLYKLFSMITNLGFLFMNNLQLWFAVAISFTLAKKEKGWAAFAGLVMFYCYMRGIQGWAGMAGYTEETVAVDYLMNHGYSEQAALNFNALWGSNIGMFGYNMGIFSGLISGAITAWIHNKFVDKTLPDALAFFQGTKYVVIMCTLASIPLAIVTYYVWPYLGSALQALTNVMTSSGLFGTWLFGTLDKALLPFGLHHLIAFPIEYSRVGGTMEIDGVVYDKNTDTYTFPSDVSIITQTIYTTKVSELGDTIDNLTISQVLEYDSNSMFSKIDPDTPIDNIEDAIRNIEISDLCNFGSNSMLNLLEVEGSDKVTLNNIGDAKINIGILTIQQLIDYGFITNDGGRYNNILTKTVDEILTQVNNLP